VTSSACTSSLSTRGPLLFICSSSCILRLSHDARDAGRLAGWAATRIFTGGYAVPLAGSRSTYSMHVIIAAGARGE
jgi:hypothetical protein